MKEPLAGGAKRPSRAEAMMCLLKASERETSANPFPLAMFTFPLSLLSCFIFPSSDDRSRTLSIS